VELVLLGVAGLGKTRCIENANLGKGLHLLTSSKKATTYHDTVPAFEFVKVCAVGPTLIARITWPVGAAENIEVVVINISAEKDIGDELHN